MKSHYPKTLSIRIKPSPLIQLISVLCLYFLYVWFRDFIIGNISSVNHLTNRKVVYYTFIHELYSTDIVNTLWGTRSCNRTKIMDCSITTARLPLKLLLLIFSVNILERLQNSFLDLKKNKDGPNPYLI